jgi:hypothetical protein
MGEHEREKSIRGRRTGGGGSTGGGTGTGRTGGGSADGSSLTGVAGVPKARKTPYEKWASPMEVEDLYTPKQWVQR